MARPVVLGNNGLTVGLDENGYVHDFYYPYVGLENLTTARSNPHYVGLWVDGNFSWLHEESWEKDINFSSDALIGKSTLLNKKLNIRVNFTDFVDSGHDVFARKVVIDNLSDEDKEIRIFFHQAFQISAEGRADTAMYVPDGHYILDYKGRCSILAYAEHSDGEVFDEWAVGNTGIEGKEGTFRDSEDGELSNSAVEHASVDSTLRCSFTTPAGQETEVRYWLCVSDSQYRLEDMHKRMLGTGFYKRLRATRQHWHDWLDISAESRHKIPQEYQENVTKSLMILKAHIDEHGGIIASCDSSIYNYGRDYYSYVWPRDGAYVIWPLIKLGYSHEPKAFFEFCNSILTTRGYLMHKYQPDRAIGSTWHPLIHGRRKELAIQEDETASVIIMLGEYLKQSNDIDFVHSLYESLVKPAANFMAHFIDEPTKLPHASYDLWEEKFLTSTYTVAVTYRALLVASEIADVLGRGNDKTDWQETAKIINQQSNSLFDSENNSYIKGFLYAENEQKIDKTVDVSSLYAAFKFSYGTEEHIDATASAIELRLLDKSPSGGSPRYEHDNYFESKPAYMGNPWFVTTLWMSQYYAYKKDYDGAKHYIDWVISNTLPSGALSEQINPSDGSVVGVTPLIWSHAELINSIITLTEKED